MNVEVRGIDIAYERNGRGQPLGFLHGHGTGTQDSGTVRGFSRRSWVAIAMRGPPVPGIGLDAQHGMVLSAGWWPRSSPSGSLQDTGGVILTPLGR